MTSIGRPTPLRRRVRSAVWFPILVALAACNTAIPIGVGSDASGRPLDRIHAQAQDALDRWAEAVRQSGGASISFVGELTSQIGDWEEALGSDYRVALMTGRVEPAVALPDDPSRGEVRWVDGSRIGVNVLSAADALADLVEAAGDTTCPECRPLLVTDANLATDLVETTQGPAEAPIWVFTIEGTSVRVTRVAVDDSVTVVPPPWNAEDPPVGMSIESAVGTADSRKLEVAFVGAVKGRDEPCGADYTAEAVESDLAVVVIVNELRHAGSGNRVCEAVGRTRTARVTLDAVLGDRAVLEVKQGLPVPLHVP